MDRRQVYCGGRITGCAETAGIRKREGLKMRNTFLPLVLDGWWCFSNLLSIHYVPMTVVGTVVVDTTPSCRWLSQPRERKRERERNWLINNRLWHDVLKHRSILVPWKHGKVKGNESFCLVFQGQCGLNIRKSFHREEGIWARPSRLAERRREGKQRKWLNKDTSLSK